MLVHFSIYRLNSSPPVQEMAEVVRTLQDTSLDFQPGPLGIRVQGEWDEVMTAIRACHQHLTRKYLRVLSTIVIDDNYEDTTFCFRAGKGAADYVAAGNVQNQMFNI